MAVHGIAADPKRTWTTNEIDWLTDDDMLPSILPGARIFRFGYESEWLGSKAVQIRISTIANQLLQAVKVICSVFVNPSTYSIYGLTSSQAEPCCQFIFVGHCFGGLVIEKVLLHTVPHASTHSS